jgi:hypothetical protein
MMIMILLYIIINGIKNQIDIVCNIEKILNSRFLFISLIKVKIQSNIIITNIGSIEVLYEK